ncbi:MAG: Wzz/FepE/Etk N-terminal domain-containing protein [Ketobacteraceae bacterium]|nr:Wzz/FepE/Etk N-terminal domain-containing protein [Ketobacteraceae bacterium]
MGHYIKQHQEGYGLISRDDEIDLFELISALRKNIGLIAGITIICVLAAMAYALLATPAFKASSIIGEPTQGTLNAIDNAVGVYPLEPEQEYSRIFQTMINQDLQYRFFLENIQPDLPEAKSELERRRNFESFRKKLSVRNQEKGRNVSHDFIQVEFTSATADEAYRVLTSFLNFMNAEILKSIAADYRAEIETTKSNLQQEISILLNARALEINSEIKRLRESLALAQKMGIKEPAITESSTLSELKADSPATHLLGEKYLSSRIELLQKRKDLAAFTSGVAALKAQLESLNSINLNTGSVDILRFEKSPTLPHNRISPKRTLIVILGLMLGIFAGCALALMRMFINNHRKSSEAVLHETSKTAIASGVAKDAAKKDALSYVLRSDAEVPDRKENKSAV